MKIGGLTWWRNNYGSILQAYALQQKILSLGIDHEIICQYGKRIASFDNFRDKVKRIGLIKTIKRIFWKFCFGKLRKRSIKLQQFVDQNLRISQEKYTEDTIINANDVYDGFISGSDQVWNVALNPETSIYWLGFVKESKLKVSYAPSVGVGKLSEKQSVKIRENLKDYKAISCREEEGTKLINKAMGETRCKTTLDPTLLVGREFWDNICPPRKFSEPYVFVYLLRGTKKERQLVESFALKMNLTIVTMPFLDTEKIELYDFKFGDTKFWDASPLDFVSAVRYADYVFTDSFHGMIFSCLYHVNFYTFSKIGKAQLNRVTGLQSLFHIPSRMIEGSMKVEKLEEMEEINWNIVDEILGEKRKESEEFLLQALKEL